MRAEPGRSEQPMHVAPAAISLSDLSRVILTAATRTARCYQRRPAGDLGTAAAGARASKLGRHQLVLLLIPAAITRRRAPL